MQPINLDGLAKYLGPGTGGLWMGEQQKNAMQESELSQAKSLEDIFKAQQDREHNAQMNPLKVEHQKGLNARQPVDLEGAILGNKEKQTKLDRDQFANFVKDLANMDPRVVGVADRAAYMDDVAKRNNVPTDHPMYQIALQAHAKGPEAFQMFRDSFTVSPETQYRETQANARTDRANDRMEANTKLIQETQERIRREDREMKLRIAEMRAKEGREAEAKLNYSQAMTAYTRAADAAEMAGDVEGAAQLRQRAQLMAQMDIAKAAAGQNTPKAGGVELPPGAGVTQRPPQPVPTVPPLNPQAGAAPAAPTQAPQTQRNIPVGAKSKTKDGRSVTWDGTGWKFD